MRGLGARVERAVDGAPGTVLILSANPMHDTGGGQRSAQVALELLEAGYAVVFVSHGRVTETVDLGLRFRRRRLVETSLKAFTGPAGAAARALLWEAGISSVITQVPVRAWLPVLAQARASGAVTVYDCVDHWDSELGAGWYREEVEHRVAREADLVVASAPELVRRLERMAEREVHLLPNAYNGRVFDASRRFERPSDLPDGPVALYVGALWGGWFDWALVRRLAETHTDLSFVFVGDYRREGAGLPPNCVFLGLKPQVDLPAYLAHAEVAILPWAVDAVTQATSPLKVYEFVAMGLPVVAPDLDPLEGIPGIRIAGDAAAFVRLVGETRRGRTSAAERAEMAAFSERNSWERRLEVLGALIGDVRTADDPHGPVPRRPDAGERGARAPGWPRTRAVVSVVVPCYNHERFVGEAIESVHDQTLPTGDLVVVDDGSVDGSRDVLARYEGGNTRVIHQANRGAHEAINRAIALSESEYVAILNSDDRIAPERIEHAWGVARARGAALVVGGVEWIDEQGQPLPEDHPGVSWYRRVVEDASRARSLHRMALRHNFAVTTSNFFVHRSLWRALGGFRAYRYVHDLDFLLRALALCGSRVAFAPELVDVSYRIHTANTIAESTERALAERSALVRAHQAPMERMRRGMSRLHVQSLVGHAVQGTRPLRAWTSAGVRGGDGRTESGPVAVSSDVRTRPLRAGLVVHRLGTGGLEEVVALLARTLPAHGVEPYVLCTHGGGQVASRLVDAGVSVTVGDGRPALWRTWSNEVAPDVLSAHFPSLAALEVLNGEGLPVIETIHNCYAWFTPEDWAQERAKAAHLAGRVAVSDVVARYHALRVGSAAGRAPDCPSAAWVIPNAVDPGRTAAVPRAWARRMLGLDPIAPVVVHHGRLARQKNLTGLVRAFAKVAEALPEATLLLAGPAAEPGYAREVRRAASGLLRSGRVRILPPLAHVGAFLSAADVFVANSFFEGWSVSASEAAWVGLPLVLSECGGSAALVGSEGERGRVVPNPAGDPLEVGPEQVRRPPPDALANNERALARALTDVLSSRDRWHHEGGAIRDHARGLLAPETMTAAYVAIFRKVAGT